MKTPTRYLLFAAFIALACFVALRQKPPKLRHNAPEPLPALVTVEPPQKWGWETVAAGHGFQPALRGHNYDPAKIGGGWRLFKSGDDYKIIYSVDEWSLVTDSKSYFELTGVKLRTVTTDHGVIKPEREPWWLYENLRTNECQFVYQTTQSNCPNGQCPLTESNNAGNDNHADAEDRDGSNGGSNLPSRPGRVVRNLWGRR